MTDVHDLRAAARQHSSNKRASGAAVMCAAIILPLAGLGAGLLARGGAQATIDPLAEEEAVFVASLDEPRKRDPAATSPLRSTSSIRAR